MAEVLKMWHGQRHRVLLFAQGRYVAAAVLRWMFEYRQWHR